MDNKKSILKHGGLLLSCVLFLGGCSNSSSHMNEILNEYACEQDAQYKVGPDREVIFYVKHHIMVGDREPGTDKWDVAGFTRTPKARIPWESSRVAFYRKQKTIPSVMQGVNEILWDNKTNIFLINDGVEIHADEHFFPADFDLHASPQGHTKQVMQQMVANDPGYIHIIYGWTSSTAAYVAGEQFATVIADDPRYGSCVTSRALTREVLNALGYQPEVDDDAEYNLLHHAATGDSMSSDQIRELWDVINEKDRALKSISCAPDE